jgi:hypothetical protein
MRKFVSQISSALALPVLLLLAGSSAMATFPGSGSASWGCSSAPSDTTFLPDGASQNDPSVFLTLTSSLTPVPPLYQTKTITTNRVVGPGTASEFDSNGFLVNWQTYIQNGVLSPHAYLQYGGVFEVETFVGTMVGVYLNGHLVKNVPLVALATGGCLEIDTQYIKFAQRVPGQSPTPGVNTIGLTLDVTQGTILGQSIIGAFGALTFQAMAPIIMVHGCCGEMGGGMGTGWFDKTNPDQNYTNQTWLPFTTPFAAQRLPYDFSINLNPENTIETDGANLLVKLRQKAAEFGAKHVHIVAHSKGGLNSRYVLRQLNQQAQQAPSTLGVYSLTTLSTPHHGSANADYYVDSAAAVSTGNSNNARVLAAKAKRLGGQDTSIPDLRVSKVEQFNSQDNQSPLPAFFTVDGVRDPVIYYAVSADAREPSASQLMLADILAMAPVVTNSNQATQATLNLQAYQEVYNLLGEVASTQFDSVSHIVLEHLYCTTPSNCFHVNDLAVTRTSANYASPRSQPVINFQEITSLQGQNHNSESNAANASGMVLTVIQKVKAAQPVQ